jgi:Holliday junction DNA helicase RuvA
VIGYIEGKLLQKYEDKILILANQVGYEVLLPGIVMQALNATQLGETIALHTYYQQTERQPKPILIGFQLEADKAFFQHFISVDAIGPQKAVKALTLPIEEIARAIEEKDVAKLTLLKGIGKRSAEKIIASLRGKMGRFAHTNAASGDGMVPAKDLIEPVIDVLVNQLGHKPADARQMVAEAFKRDATISTSEALLEEVYRGDGP